ncbi:hypothetical protein EMIHUDRAFT_450958 [Emiliania huxleyi CCMP1516]|uniref:Uncharacterized protein n=2 Tax=Emiliania huxleyi TaxID=2903 RepID=A0A0D3JAI0_EMIH1|nr:hypothetical protein EMIHUDRAFT_450958 [Emiliania huxleyi CCMP1516]EOD20515.1 hypothetical protein EMIHUDRAFT_450958 [Emiliania huxleyi CCMP1516]|eukprot:XP_005772944.1 hypothetical protein EMIHUDRAFT_450958 [Emiliania huxleyi CCMP1516]
MHRLGGGRGGALGGGGGVEAEAALLLLGGGRRWGSWWRRRQRRWRQRRRRQRRRRQRRWRQRRWRCERRRAAAAAELVRGGREVAGGGEVAGPGEGGASGGRAPAARRARAAGSLCGGADGDRRRRGRWGRRGGRGRGRGIACRYPRVARSAYGRKLECFGRPRVRAVRRGATSRARFASSSPPCAQRRHVWQFQQRGGDVLLVVGAAVGQEGPVSTRRFVQDFCHGRGCDRGQRVQLRSGRALLHHLHVFSLRRQGGEDAAAGPGRAGRRLVRG